MKTMESIRSEESSFTGLCGISTTLDAGGEVCALTCGDRCSEELLPSDEDSSYEEV